jgi:F-type H+-transporting ATPase subunit epsilon
VRPVAGAANAGELISGEQHVAGKSFEFRLITPTGKLVDAPAVSVTFPAHDGLMGVLPDRAPTVVKLGMGELKVSIADSAKGQGGNRSFFVEDGFAQMVNGRLTVLAARAVPAEEISESSAQAELAAAEGRSATGLNTTETLRRERDRARQKLTIARSRSGKGI